MTVLRVLLSLSLRLTSRRGGTVAGFLPVSECQHLADPDSPLETLNHVSPTRSPGPVGIIGY